MSTSPDLGIPFISGQQAQPEITLNEALVMLHILAVGVIQTGVNDPPSGSPGPQDGDAYIIGTSPTGAWAGRANSLTMFVEGEWRFVPGFDSDGAIIPMGARQEGLKVWDKFDNEMKVWADSDGSPGELAWRPYTQLSTDLTRVVKLYDQNISNAANSTSCTGGADTTLPMVNDGTNQFIVIAEVAGKVSFDATFNSNKGGLIVDNLSQYTKFGIRITVVNLDASQVNAVAKAFLVFDKTIPGTGVSISKRLPTLTQNVEESVDLTFFHDGIEAVYPRINCAATRNIRLNGVELEAREPQ